MHIHEKIAV